MTDDTQPTRFIVEGLDRSTRLDRVLGEHFPQCGRRAVQGLINAKKVKVNGRVVWLCSWQVENGDRIVLSKRPGSGKSPPPSFDPGWIMEDSGDIIAVNKPAGLLSHATRASRNGDLLTLLSRRFGKLFLFHRLDRDTSGIVLLTRGAAVNRHLDAAFKDKTVEKEYLALVSDPEGVLRERGVIDNRIGTHPKRRDMMAVVERGGRRAVTRYQVIGEADRRFLLRLRPETGRTHQLRVHMAHLGVPILGDSLYGEKGRAKRLMLHACRLSLPAGDGFPARSYLAPPPEDFLRECPEGLKERLMER